MPFYVMRQDTLIDGARSLDGVPDDWDNLNWKQGNTTQLPEENTVLDLSLESGDYRGDILEGLAILYSDELKQALDEQGVDTVLYYPIRLRDQHTGITEGGYWLVNITAVYDCIDLKKSMIKRSVSDVDENDFEILSLVIDKKKTHGAKIFRLHNDPTLVIINEELKQFFDETDLLVGVEIIRTEDYSEW